MQKKIIITYGTYDLLHIGHINLLKRAKALGDYLIVGVTSEDYDRSRGKLNVKQSTKKRVKEIKKLDFVDEITFQVPENYYLLAPLYNDALHMDLKDNNKNQNKIKFSLVLQKINVLDLMKHWP